jgi:hypothetical protein
LKVLITLLCFLVFACKNAGQPEQALQKAWRINSVDSFKLGDQRVFLKTLVNQGRDSFHLICDNGHLTYLALPLDSPPGWIRAQNITGDSLPEIIVDDCLGCDLGRLRLFSFDRIKQGYSELKGTDSLLSEIYPLNGTDLAYTVACFNQSGCESILLRIQGDSCIALGRMHVPYSEEPIRLTGNGNPSTRKLVPMPQDLNTDSLIPFLWKTHFLDKSNSLQQQL